MSLQQDLRALYLLDKQVRGMRSRLDNAERRLKAQQTRFDQFKQQRMELLSQQRHAQAKAADLENQAQGVEERIAKHRQQMNAVTTNKEYSALLVEVNTLKLEKGKIEEQALEHLGEVERLGEEIREVDAQLADREKLVAGAQKDVDEARADVGEELDALTARRDEAATKLPPEALQAFERSAYAHEGEAMAEIEEIDRRRMEYQCGGCYMQIPVERVNALMSRADDLVTCTSCGRILYVSDELKSALTPK